MYAEKNFSLLLFRDFLVNANNCNLRKAQIHKIKLSKAIRHRVTIATVRKQQLAEKPHLTERLRTEQLPSKQTAQNLTESILYSITIETI